MFIGLSTFSFTLKHCSKLPFSPENRATVRRQLRLWRLYSTACHVFMHAGFIRHLPRHSSLCVSAIIHAKHFIFCTHNKNKWPYSLQSRCCFSSTIISGLQGKTWAPKHVSNSNKNETEWLYFLSICKEDISFLPTKHYKKKKKKITQPTHLLPLVFVTVILSWGVVRPWSIYSTHI